MTAPDDLDGSAAGEPDLGARPLADFPLRAEPAADLGLPSPPAPAPSPSGLALLPDRAIGTAADAAVSILLVLAGLLAAYAARDEGTGRRLTATEAVRRWTGTLATVAAIGLPLFFTARDADAPTLADRLSGRTLARDV